jgi:urate oxidase
MNEFATGVKKNYYGKGDIIAYRLNPDAAKPVFGVNAKLLIYGDAFWSTYTTGDNTGLIATDSMKNFVQRETLNFPDDDLESYCRFLAAKFMDKYPQVAGVQVSAAEIPYEGSIAFSPAGPERAAASIELTREGLIEVKSGIEGFRLLRLNGSAFYGFVRDEYTTLPDIKDRPLHMWLDLDWSYTSVEAAFTRGAITKQVRGIVREVFEGFASGSIQQIIYQIGEKMLANAPSIAEIRLEANNRTWDTVVEGVYTDARPPYGILGLTMKR